mgnify:CR=1 FL=1
MRFGHFDDARREYVIDTPRTPLPWINYLGSEDFFSLVSNTGGGYSFYRDARLRRLTRYRYNNSPLDMDGHRIYINDGGTIWNPGCSPPRRNWTVTPAATVWATRSCRAKKTALRPLRSCSCPGAMPVRSTG